MGWVANTVFLLAGAFKRSAAFGVAATYILLACLALSESSAAVEPCQNSPLAAEPCPGVVDKWRSFLELQDLHASLAAARSFEAFLAGHDDEGERFLALARGHNPSSTMTMDNYGTLEMARVQRRREGGCAVDPYASNPCLGVAGAWASYAQNNGLGEDWDSARDFVGSLNGGRHSERPPADSTSRSKEQEARTVSQSGIGLIIRVYPGSAFEGS